jgi:hypothetical protein
VGVVGADHAKPQIAEASEGMVARHISRFGRVSTRYPLRVIEAYDVDLRRAQAETDEQVAAQVAMWERTQGLQLRDWHDIGRYERGEIPASELGPVERRMCGLTEE